MNMANLNYYVLRKHLDRLLGCGFIVKVKDTDVYELTESGRAFLDEYARFRSLENMLMNRIEDEVGGYIGPG